MKKTKKSMTSVKYQRGPKGQKKNFGKNIKRITLKDTLQNVYHKVNLDTTMSCECVCCKVAMPSMNYCEFTQIISEIWSSFNEKEKADLICGSLEYFFKNEFEKFGIQTLVKPCLLQDDNGLCKFYESRPLSCRMFGLWPKDMYSERVEKFANAYSKYGLVREDLPLFHQCPLVKRVDNSTEITKDIILSLYKELDVIDKGIGEHSDLQISQKYNYRAFHDWVMLKIFGEEWLSKLTTFMLAANKEQIDDQIEKLKDVVYSNIKLLNDKMIKAL